MPKLNLARKAKEYWVSNGLDINKKGNVGPIWKLIAVLIASL